MYLFLKNKLNIKNRYILTMLSNMEIEYKEFNFSNSFAVVDLFDELNIKNLHPSMLRMDLSLIGHTPLAFIFMLYFWWSGAAFSLASEKFGDVSEQ